VQNLQGVCFYSNILPEDPFNLIAFRTAITIHAVVSTTSVKVHPVA
jgi:hypothetical protein